MLFKKTFEDEEQPKYKVEKLQQYSVIKCNDKRHQSMSAKFSRKESETQKLNVF